MLNHQIHLSNPRKIGYYRDNEICEAILRHRCLSQEQIKLLFFQGIKEESAIRQSQKRLKKLKDKSLIKRWRCEIDETYNYYIQDIAQKEHIVMANWMLMWYMIKHKYEKIYYLDYQLDLEILIPDIFLITYNPYDKKQPYKGIFFEMDKTISNEFDKIKKYNKLIEEGILHNQDCAKVLTKFPQVYIATTSKYRLIDINKRVVKENNNTFNKPITFKTYMINDLKEECINAFKSNEVNNNGILQLGNSCISSSIN